MTPSLVLPRYGEASLSDLLPSIVAALGVAGERNDLDLAPARAYCLLLVDGLGWNLLRAHPAQAPFLASMLPSAAVLTAGVPSTTATSLASLGTGLAPGRHGLLGYTVRIPGTGDLLNALRWSTAVDPRQWQPHPTVFERAAAAGVEVTVVGQRKFRTSGLTVAGLRSRRFSGADTFGERIAVASASLDGRSPALVYVYDGDLDFTGHRAGCASAAWRYQLTMVDRFAEELHAALPPGCALVVTGDHGMVDVPAERRVDVDDVPALREGVSLVGGEARLRHVYAAEGAAEDVAASWATVLGPRAVVAARDDAVARGWFGAVESRVLDRLGDVVVACTGDLAVERRSVFPVEARLVGLHGSLSADEMLVPLLLATS